MRYNLHFSPELLNTVVGGVSVLDIPRLHISSLEEAYSFIKTYGFDMSVAQDRERVWSFHRQAVVFMQDQLLQNERTIPQELADPEQLKDVGYLLVYASIKVSTQGFEAASTAGGSLTVEARQIWSCAILRVMHVLSHLKNDIYNLFANEIYEQILGPVKKFVREDHNGKLVMSQFPTDHTGPQEIIELHSFEAKPLKSKTSSLIKLLAKKDEVALRLLDKVGMRIITHNVFDSFRVLRFLFEQHLIAAPNIIADQTRNTLYPNNLFVEVMTDLEKHHPVANLNTILHALEEKILAEQGRAEYNVKENNFSSDRYRAIKFIARQLVHVPMGNNNLLQTFFPFEVQIVDIKTHKMNMSGHASHEEYKNRQKLAARKRVFGDFL